VNSRSEQKPVKEYLDAQGRFRGMSPEQIDYLQRATDARRKNLLDANGKRLFI